MSAPLTSTPLIGILNGNFDTTLDGWTTRGITTILNEQATLSEDERFLSNLSQTFQIPERAKYLQFTLLDWRISRVRHDAPYKIGDRTQRSTTTRESFWSSNCSPRQCC
ncbi:MAG: hypothetical protein F6K32_02715 [Desertifilum sp. SIO1I2]|nr:hypothetical protein [Desertifilum sp. SIO1I2]